MGSSLNFLTGSLVAGVLEDEDDADPEAAGCLALLTSIFIEAVCPCELRAFRMRRFSVYLLDQEVSVHWLTWIRGLDALTDR